MALLIPAIIGVSTAAVTFLATKGVSLSKAVDDIDYSIKVKDFRIHSVSILQASVIARFSLDIKLINPTLEKFTISHPDVVINYAGKKIGSSKIQSKDYVLGKRSEVTIKDIEFQIDLGYLRNELKDFFSEVVQGWKAGNGLVKNISDANTVLSSYQDVILKHLSAKITLIVNRVPISYEDTLAGGQSFGKFVLGYAPISAIDRGITACPQYDKYFPARKGTKKMIKRNANVFQTVSLMIDIVEQDHKLIREASHKIFKRSTVEETTKNIFDWIYKHIKYDLEVGEQLRNPATTYHLGQRLARKHYKEKGFYNQDFTADCDDMSIFIASILRNLNIPYMFRIADYSGGGYSHVYTLVPRKGKPPIIIDPVYHQYNSEKKYVKEKTFDMNKNELSGTDVYYLAGIPNILGDIEMNTLEYLVNSRNAIEANPEAYAHIAPASTLIEMYDYAIQYWNTPYQSEALAVLAEKEDELIDAGIIQSEGIGKLKDSKFFKKIKEFAQKRKLKKEGKGDIVENTYMDRNDYSDPNNNLPANTDVDDSNYAANPNNISSSSGSSNFGESVKLFVSKYKIPIIIGAGLTATGIAWGVSNNKRKKAQNNG